jgi:probable rRNA maturation factor
MSELFAALSVEVTVSCDAWFDDCPDAAALATGAAQAALLDSAGGEHLIVDVTLADDVEQRRLNRTYRGKDMATNVLAFPQGVPDSSQSEAPVLLGDVVLALETVRREAADQRKPLANHLRHLVIHGVLHLLGFDHEEAKRAAEMEAREIKILAGLGVPDPYRGIM